jgi:amino acid permease
MTTSKNSSDGSIFQLYFMNKFQQGSDQVSIALFKKIRHIMTKNIYINKVKGSMFTMTVAIIGVGILALPYAVKQAGLILGLILILLGAIVTNFSLRLLLISADFAQARSFMDLARATGGNRFVYFVLFFRLIQARAVF